MPRTGRATHALEQDALPVHDVFRSNCSADLARVRFLTLPQLVYGLAQEHGGAMTADMGTRSPHTDSRIVRPIMSPVNGIRPCYPYPWVAYTRRSENWCQVPCPTTDLTARNQPNSGPNFGLAGPVHLLGQGGQFKHLEPPFPDGQLDGELVSLA